jgi:hypothetical protein
MDRSRLAGGPISHLSIALILSSVNPLFYARQFFKTGRSDEAKRCRCQRDAAQRQCATDITSPRRSGLKRMTMTIATATTPATTASA